MQFDVIDKAGLTQTQFANLVGVSRVTVNTWVRGHMKPRRHIQPRVARALKLINEALEARRLPVDPRIWDVAVTRQLERLAASLAREA